MDLIPLDQFDDSHLETLIEGVEGAHISLTMPVQREADKRAENQIRLKNLLRKAREDLSFLDFGQTDIAQLLAPAKDFFQEGRYLATDSPGLAIYLAHHFSLALQLPYAPEEMAMVCPEFLIKPLMPLLLREHLYILAVSQQEVRLLRATQFTVERLDLADMPESLAEALRWDDPERELQWHSKTGKGDHGRPAIFHGHGVGSQEKHNERLRRYSQLLDQGLSKYLVNEDAPLILAGVDFLLAIYREVCSYQHIIEETITGNPQQLNDGQLQEQAWEIIQPYFDQERKAAVSLFHQQSSKMLASTDLTKIIPAAHQGRVATLFVARDEQEWGTYDLGTGHLDIHSHRQPGDSDLLNLATIHATLNKGNIFTGSREEIPNEEPLASIFRF